MIFNSFIKLHEININSNYDMTDLYIRPDDVIDFGQVDIGPLGSHKYCTKVNVKNDRIQYYFVSETPDEIYRLLEKEEQRVWDKEFEDERRGMFD